MSFKRSTKARIAVTTAAVIGLSWIAGLAVAGGTPVAPDKSPAGAAQATRQLTATNTQSCMKTTELVDRDGDLRRNQKEIWSNQLCIRQHVFTEGVKWIIHEVTNPSRPDGPLWVVPHDNEKAAFDTAIYALGRYGGTLLAVETGGFRYNHGVDPNRNFTGNAAVCGRRSPKYTAFFMDRVVPGEPIIALHTNMRRSIWTGGAGTVSMKKPSKGAFAFPAKHPIKSQSPSDTMVYVSALRPPGAEPWADRRTQMLNALGVNVMREGVSPKNDDCSLSNFLALRGVKDYFAVEAVSGDKVALKTIVDLLLTNLGRL
jgi:hypothetical protein